MTSASTTSGLGRVDRAPEAVTWGSRIPPLYTIPSQMHSYKCMLIIMSDTDQALRDIEAANHRLAEAKRALICARYERNAAIARAHKCGVRQTALAEHLGVSQSRIHQLIATTEGAPA